MGVIVVVNLEFQLGKESSRRTQEAKNNNNNNKKQ
jgi:hypothetical protein